MEPSQDPLNLTLSFGLKRKQPDDAGARTPKIGRVDASHGMPISSCHHGLCSCCSQHCAVASNHLNFLKTATPRRIMVYAGGEWSDFPENVTSLLIEAFGAKRSAVEVAINGARYMFDFLSMVLIDLRNGAQRSVSWIDESNKCFFPVLYLDEEGSGSNGCNNRGNAPGGGRPDVGRGQPVEVKNVDEEGRPPLVSLRQAVAINTLTSEIEKMDRGSRGFNSVVRAFLLGMGTFASPSSLTGIYRYTPKIRSALNRQEKFKEQERTTKYHRGTANARYAWLGMPREGIFRILLNGFGRGTEVTVGAAYGTGIYLTPENRSFASVKHCDADENGTQYILLCRVIMGNIEKVPAGSRQSFASSSDFDCGVDDLIKPKCYVVWSALMDTHIHPQYVVSFKLSPAVREYLADLNYVGSNTNMVTAQHQRNVSVVHPSAWPNSPWIPFTLLFAALKERISPIAMELLELHYGELKNNMLSQAELISKMRVIVGEKLLVSTLKRIKQSIR